MLSKYIYSGLATGLTLFARAAMVDSSSLELTEWKGRDLVVWNSRVTPIIFGDDAEYYDYETLSPSLASAAKMIEAAETFRTAFASGNEGAILSAFLNTTQLGTLTPEQDSDLKWKCGELVDITRAHCSLCAQWVDELRGSNFIINIQEVEEPLAFDESMLGQQPLAE